MPGRSNALRQPAVKHKILLTIFCTKQFLLARRAERSLPQFPHVNRWKRASKKTLQPPLQPAGLTSVWFPKRATDDGILLLAKKKITEWGETNPVYSSLYGCLISKTPVTPGVIRFPFHSLPSFHQFGWHREVATWDIMYALTHHPIILFTWRTSTGMLE